MKTAPEFYARTYPDGYSPGLTIHEDYDSHIRKIPMEFYHADGKPYLYPTKEEAIEAAESFYRKYILESLTRLNRR